MGGADTPPLLPSGILPDPFSLEAGRTFLSSPSRKSLLTCEVHVVVVVAVVVAVVCVCVCLCMRVSLEGNGLVRGERKAL